MSRFAIKIDLLPGYGYSSDALYSDASNGSQLRQIIADAKANIAAYRISVNGEVVCESKSSGAKRRWYKQSSAYR